MRRLLKLLAPKFFNDGLERCNAFGKELVPRKGIERLLDTGCGEGDLTMELAEIVRPKEIYGIEFVDKLRQKAEKRGIRCYQGDLNRKWKFNDDFFDLIFSSQLIEHLHNTRLYIEECYRCLKPSGGQLIILTENLASWGNIGALLFGWQPFSTATVNGWSLGNPLIWHLDEEKKVYLDKYQKTGNSGLVGHVRVLTPRGLKDLMEKVGFKNVKIGTKGYFPFWGKLSDCLCRLDKNHGHFLIATGFK